jgi:hypothetical protein
MMKAPIAQLDRASDYESAGRVFESPWARHESCKVRGSRAPHTMDGTIWIIRIKYTGSLNCG